MEATQQQRHCPEGCCQEGDILCISIPCPIQIVLLGINLELSLPCLRLSSTNEITPDQVNRLIQFISGLLGGINLPVDL